MAGEAALYGGGGSGGEFEGKWGTALSEAVCFGSYWRQRVENVKPLRHGG